MKNENLHKAKVAKNDEFYTRLADIEKELKNYKLFENGKFTNESYFKDKIVYCNCDSRRSNFVKYFALNFNKLGLKKLIATCYGPAEADGRATKIVIDKVVDYDNNGSLDFDDINAMLDSGALTYLEGDGDFASDECVELLKEADIVVTNPPFSLYRKFIALLDKYDKKYTVIANQNSITYKEIFPLIKNNKMWLGYNTVKEFVTPTGDTRKFGNISWFTNIFIQKRTEKLISDLYKKYNAEEYPTYDNYDAINVDKVADIPCDYMGVMGVPITFLDKYNPDEFEIVNANDIITNKQLKEKSTMLIKDAEATLREEKRRERSMLESASRELLAPGADGWHINGRRKYARVFIQRRN